MDTNVKSKIRICRDCKQAPAKGIRSTRCVDCDIERKRQKTREWNARRSAEARKNWSPICEYDGCSEMKYSTRFATKWCEYHKNLLKYEYQQQYKQRIRDHKIANPGRCQNFGCTNDSFSYKAKYCSPCRKEVVRSQKRSYAIAKNEDHNKKNVMIAIHVRDQLNLLINDTASSGNRLDTAVCHRLGAILLQLRVWNS